MNGDPYNSATKALGGDTVDVDVTTAEVRVVDHAILAHRCREIDLALYATEDRTQITLLVWELRELLERSKGALLNMPELVDCIKNNRRKIVEVSSEPR